MFPRLGAARAQGRLGGLRCDEREVSIAAGGRTSGALFLRAHTGALVHIDEPAVEGSLLPESLAGLRATRIEQELAGY